MKIVVCIICILSLFACGGGGSSVAGVASSSSSLVSGAPTSVNLQKLSTTAVGAVFTAQLNGVDSDGINYTGTLSITNLDQIVLGGVLVTPRRFLLTGYVTGSSNPSFEINKVVNVDSSTGNLISQYDFRNRVVCGSVSPYHMPDSIKVGDFGSPSTLTCSDSTTVEGSWLVEARDSNFVLVETSAKKDSARVVSVDKISYTLDANGNILAFKETITFSYNNYSLTFTSKQST